MVIKSFIAFSFLLFVGGAIFMVLERGEAKNLLSPKREIALAKALILQRYNTSEKEMKEIFGKVETAMEQNGVKEPYKWDYYESCFFVGSLLTTIGYGHITPKTMQGQLVAILFSLLGIPLTVLVVRRLSNKIIDVVTITVKFASKCGNRRAIATENTKVQCISKQGGSKIPARRAHEDKQRSKNRFLSINRKKNVACVAILFIMVLLFLTFSSIIRVICEGWTLEQSIYFWFMTLTTVGFGDFVPFEGRLPPSKVLTVVYYIGTFYLVFGLALIASLIESILEMFEGILPPAGSEVSRANSVSQTHNFDLEEGSEARSTAKQPIRLKEHMHTEGEMQNLHEPNIYTIVAWS